MKNKVIFIILFVCTLFSCSTQRKATMTPYVIAYKFGRFDGVSPAYIFLRTQPKTFEHYYPDAKSSVFGDWKESNDTLYLFPKYECDESKSQIIEKGDSNMLTVNTIEQKYLKKEDCIVDVTDYSIIFPELSYYGHTTYKKIKSIYLQPYKY